MSVHFKRDHGSSLTRNVAFYKMTEYNFLSKWLSFIILRVSSDDIKVLFRKLERLTMKLIKETSHRKFNETCIINYLLPKYTNIYIYIYIYIYKQQKAHRHGPLHNSELCCPIWPAMKDACNALCLQCTYFAVH